MKRLCSGWFLALIFVVAGTLVPLSLIHICSIDMMGAATMSWDNGVVVDNDVAQLRRGDLDALSALVTRYQNRLYRYLLRIVRQPAEAEDLFQVTWIRVAEKIQRYDPNRNFEAWLFTLARNVAIDHLRRIRPESLDEPVGDDATGETGATRLQSHEQPALCLLYTSAHAAGITARESR